MYVCVCVYRERERERERGGEERGSVGERYRQRVHHRGHLLVCVYIYIEREEEESVGERYRQGVHHRGHLLTTATCMQSFRQGSAIAPACQASSLNRASLRVNGAFKE